MDLFESTNQFSQYIRTLTPSIKSLNKVSIFALKHSENEDNFMSTMMKILENPKVELSNKCRIFQFVEVLIHESHNYQRENKLKEVPYIDLLKKLLPRILECVLPDCNNSHIHNVYTSLCNISKEVGAKVNEYSSAYIDDGYYSMEYDGNELGRAWRLLIEKKRQSRFERLESLSNLEEMEDNVEEEQMFNIRSRGGERAGGQEKKKIFLRIEEDREAHKRSKENFWMVNRVKEKNYISEKEFYEYYWQVYRKMNEKESQQFLESLEENNRVFLDSYKDRQD